MEADRIPVVAVPEPVDSIQVITVPPPRSAPLMVLEETKDSPVVFRDGTERSDGLEGFERSGSEVIDLAQQLFPTIFQFILDNIEQVRDQQQEAEDELNRS